MRGLLVEHFGAPDDLALVEVETPAPSPGEVLVDVAAIGVNFPDILVIGGRYQMLPELPFSPGKEFSGVVVAVGEAVERLAVGDRVLAQVEYGAYREQLVVPERLCSLLPDGMDFTEAAAFPLCALTAHFGLHARGQLQAGETVLVTGAAGGVGLAAVQIAKAAGARVIAVASTDRKRQLSLDSGADIAVDADPGTLRDDVLAATDGRGADLVLENIGGDVFHACLRALAWEGRLVISGFASGEVPSAKANYLLVKNISVVGLQVSDYRDRDHAGWLAAQEHLLELWEADALRVVVQEAFAFDRAAEALQDISTRSVAGRVVLTTRTGGVK